MSDIYLPIVLYMSDKVRHIYKLAASFTEKTENMDRKSYNVNTKSGRKNIRNKYQNDYQNKSPKEKNELDEMIFWGRAILFVIAMVVCILIVAFGGKIN